MESFRVSAIITCYNHGNYLAYAIESVLKQTVACVQVLVVDDGSTDHTREVTSKYSSVQYIYQKNQGLSAARNTGIKHAIGDFLFFLDADDWLFPNAVEDQKIAFDNHPDAMAICGDFRLATEDGSRLFSGRRKAPTNNAYLNFLESNIAGMHATVFFRQKFFEEKIYDVDLKAAEDYDIMLYLTRNHPFYMHDQVLAAYRKHDTNMSRNIQRMHESVLKVLNRQREQLRTDEEKAFLQKGIHFWNEFYAMEIFYAKMNSLSLKGEFEFTGWEEKFLKNHQYKKYIKLLMMSYKPLLKRIVKKLVGKPLIGKFQSRKFNGNVLEGGISWGSFKRTRPFSEQFGYDRGGPIDRFYIEKFLQENSDCIKGTVLEIADNSYTLQFGKEKVTKSEVLHVREGHPGATIIGDLSNASAIPIPSNHFDCIILTQTLHLIPDYVAAIKECHRILKTGGVLLLTTPGLSPIDKGEWKKNWLWSFNKFSIEKIIGENFSGISSIVSRGNVFSATSFLWGLGLSEVPDLGLLEQDDESYPVVVVAKCVKQ